MTPLQALLWPASVVYEGIVAARAWCYRKGIFRQRHLGGVVISVGNLTVGGTGKTPMVLWLAQRLVAESKRVGVLTRGYRGFLNSGSHQTPSAQLSYHRPQIVKGDEVCLLLRRMLGPPEVPERFMIGVGPDRYARGRKLERQGIEWFVLDDGFQHLELARDVDIVVIDATNPFGGGHVLPSGRLREPRSALKRADIIVITRSDHSPAVEAIVRRYASAPIFYAQVELDGIFRAMGKAIEPVPDWRQKRFFTFCAIGNPAAFFEDIRKWGLQSAGSVTFRDHHVYSQRDSLDLERRAQAAGADALLCTEKDTLNVVATQFHNFPVCYCRISLKITDADQFWNQVASLIQRRRPQVRL